MEKNAESAEQEVGSAHPPTRNDTAKAAGKSLQKRSEMLAGRLRAGDRAAAAELVDRYHERIYLFMRRLGHSYQLSEDLTQETFLRAWRHIGQLRDGTALEAWLYQIASNVSRLHWRKGKNRQPVSTQATEMADCSPAEYDKIGDREQLSRLKDAVEKLPWKLKQAVVLHYMQHLSIAEAAEAAEVRQGTLKSRLNRALNHLRKRIS